MNKQELRKDENNMQNNMQKSDMKVSLEKIYQNIQSLELRPTEHNVMLIADSLLQLKNVYAGLQEPEQNSKEEKAEVVNDGEAEAESD